MSASSAAEQWREDHVTAVAALHAAAELLARANGLVSLDAANPRAQLLVDQVAECTAAVALAAAEVRAWAGLRS